MLFKNKFNPPHSEREFYCVPGGGIDEHEGHLEAAKRELLEEEGLVSDHWEYFILAGRKTESYTWLNHVYVARDCEKTAKPALDSGEKIEHLLYSPEEFFQLLDHSDFRHQDLLAELLQIRVSEEKRKTFLEKLGIQ